MRVITSSFCLPEKENVVREGRELAVADLGTTTIAVEWYDGSGEKKGEYVCSNTYLTSVSLIAHMTSPLSP